MESPKIHQSLTLVYSAFLAAAFVYLMVAVFLRTTEWKPVMPNRSLPLFGVLLLAALVDAAIILKQKASLFSQGEAQARGDFRQFVISRCVFWFALAEIPAILGFLFFILAGSLEGMLVLVALSLVVVTLARPSRRQLEELENRSLATEAQRHGDRME